MCDGLDLLTPLLSPAAIIVAAVIAWHVHRKIAARDAAIKFIAESEIYNPEWHKANREFFKCARESRFPKDAGDPTWTSVSLVLHHYEFVAVAIKTKSMSEELYKQLSGPGYVSAWKSAASHIRSQRQQTGEDFIYSEFESLAQKWSRSTP